MKETEPLSFLLLASSLFTFCPQTTNHNYLASDLVELRNQSQGDFLRNLSVIVPLSQSEHSLESENCQLGSGSAIKSHQRTF